MSVELAPKPHCPVNAVPSALSLSTNCPLPTRADPQGQVCVQVPVNTPFAVVPETLPSQNVYVPVTFAEPGAWVR